MKERDGFREPSRDVLAEADAIGVRADAIYQWLRARVVTDPREQLPDEIASALRGRALLIAVVEKRTVKESTP
jgi:hypothetical protein